MTTSVIHVHVKCFVLMGGGGVGWGELLVLMRNIDIIGGKFINKSLYLGYIYIAPPSHTPPSSYLKITKPTSEGAKEFYLTVLPSPRFPSGRIGLSGAQVRNRTIPPNCRASLPNLYMTHLRTNSPPTHPLVNTVVLISL